MASNFPAGLDTGSTTLRTDIASNDDLNTAGKEHDVQHVNSNDSSIELQKKVGIGTAIAADALAGTILTRTSVAGTTAWVQLNSSADNIISNQVFS